MEAILLVIASVFIAATMLPMIRYGDWWIRIFDFPRSQIALGGVIVLTLYIFSFNSANPAEDVLLLALSASVSYQMYKMYPYTPIASRQVLDSGELDPDRIFSILVSNIYRKNRDADRFVDLVGIKKPDIICVLEPDEWWESKLSVLDPDYPFSNKHITSDGYGMIFFSKLKILSTKVNFIVENHIPSIHSILELRSGDVMEFYCVHPDPPNPKYAEDTDKRDAELLIIGKAAKKSELPVIVAGDLNDVAWSHTTLLFQKVSGMLDPRIGRGFYNTFHVRNPVLRFPLDHVFVTKSFRLVELKRMQDIGSDHFPIYVKLSFEPEKKGAQELKKPRASEEDMKEALEKIRKAL